MIKYAVKYLKNVIVPLDKVPDDIDINDKLVLVRTEKGEEVLKPFRVCPKVGILMEESEKTPQHFEFIRIMSQEDMMIYEEIKKDEVTSFFKCKELVQKHNLNIQKN